MTLQYQLAEGENQQLLTLRYLFPLTNSLKLGFFAADSKIDLRQEFEEENLNARGKSKFFSLFARQELINKETLEGDELDKILDDSTPTAPEVVPAKTTPESTKAKTQKVTKKAPILTEPPPEASPGYA